ncbi:galactose oxidase [Gigaspora margarita]|uniref:Galactose oxidase n=1 Tax=Gigaspora margarita TaxID=4874 RepID=A0A8H4ATJ9_GIGMA|nr:galactose oxidase [Gigaspora margarita]
MKRSSFLIPAVSILILLTVLFPNVSSASKKEFKDYEILKENSGINAMHICLTAPDKMLIIDKVQNNSIHLPDGRPVSTLEYDLNTGKKRFLSLQSNTFCSSGGFIADGTLVSTGGAEQIPDKHFKAGFSALRFFKPCQNDKCKWREDLNGMMTHRWYSTSTTLSDGRLFILGGSKVSIAVNNKTMNNPTFEFYPRTDPTPIDFPFLIETLPYNLYPIVHLMPGPKDQTLLFVFANKDSILFDWDSKKTVHKFPRLEGASRSYPLTGTSVMLPLRPEDNYIPQILVCGGNEKNDTKHEAANSCGRIKIDLSNLDKAKWEIDDFGGIPRVMPDGVILADGQILFLNGAKTGIAGYSSKLGKVKNKLLKADNPDLTPVLYDGQKPKGKRFTKLNHSTIPRLYHSVASLLPNGQVFISGSSPQSDVTLSGVKFPTEFRIEMFSPPYLSSNTARATIKSVNGSKKLNQGPIKVKYNKHIKVDVELSDKKANFTAAIVHYGFITHSVHMSERYVFCDIKNIKRKGNGYTMDVVMPPNGNIMPPVPVYLYINNNGVPGETAVHLHLSK